MQHGFARVGGRGEPCGLVTRVRCFSILPRQGEVAPRATEGEDTKQRFRMPPPPSGKSQKPPPCWGVLSANLSLIEDHPSEGRGPSGKAVVMRRGPSLATFPNWAPASAGVEQLSAQQTKLPPLQGRVGVGHCQKRLARGGAPPQSSPEGEGAYQVSSETTASSPPPPSSAEARPPT